MQLIAQIPGHIGIDNVDIWFEDEVRFGQ